MKKFLICMIVGLGMLIVVGAASAVPISDTIEWDVGFFTPDETQTYNSPYYRWYDEDWGWQHNAISETFTTATLNISAWDVDAAYGEVDVITVWDNDENGGAGGWVELGSLVGTNDEWGYSSFTLSSTLFDDIANGLQVWMDIDSTHTYDVWAVSLAKSVLSLDGGSLPNPNPSPTVPEPSTILLMGVGILGLMGFSRKRFSKKS